MNHDDDLTGTITNVLQRRADAVAVHDRLDDIVDRRLPAALARRRSGGTGRWVLTAAAVLATVSATAALLQWAGGDEALRTSPAEGSGAIHPVLGDLSELAGTGAPAPLVQRSLDEASLTSRLVIGRRDGANVVDIVQVTVSDAPDPAEAAPVGVVRRIGDRLVEFLPGPTGRVGMIIWMDPEASTAEIAEVETRLDEAAAVAGLTFVNQEAAYEEFRLHYADSPEIGELVEADELPTSFRVQLVSDDEGLATVLREDLRNLPGVSFVDSGEFEPYGDRYRWDEAEARVTVIGGTGAEAAVAAVVVTAGPYLPRVTVGELPGGLEVLAGASEPWGGPLPRLEAAAATGLVRVGVREHPMLPPSASYATVAVGEAEGLLHAGNGEVTVAWPVPGSDLWATLSVTTSTPDPDLAIRLAAGVTFTDRSTWEGLYTGTEAGETTETTSVVATTTPGTGTVVTVPAEVDATIDATIDG